MWRPCGTHHSNCYISGTAVPGYFSTVPSELWSHRSPVRGPKQSVARRRRFPALPVFVYTSRVRRTKQPSRARQCPETGPKHPEPRRDDTRVPGKRLYRSFGTMSYRVDDADSWTMALVQSRRDETIHSPARECREGKGIPKGRAQMIRLAVWINMFPSW